MSDEYPAVTRTFIWTFTCQKCGQSSDHRRIVRTPNLDPQIEDLSKQLVEAKDAVKHLSQDEQDLLPENDALRFQNHMFRYENERIFLALKQVYSYCQKNKELDRSKIEGMLQEAFPFPLADLEKYPK
jgi:hypothetical protein